MSCTSSRVNLDSIICLNVKEILARSRCHIWSLSDNDIRTHNHLVPKRTLNHLAKLGSLRTKWLWVWISLLSFEETLLNNSRFCTEHLGKSYIKIDLIDWKIFQVKYFPILRSKKVLKLCFNHAACTSLEWIFSRIGWMSSNSLLEAGAISEMQSLKTQVFIQQTLTLKVRFQI